MLVGSGQNPSWATRLKFPTVGLSIFVGVGRFFCDCSSYCFLFPFGSLLYTLNVLIETFYLFILLIYYFLSIKKMPQKDDKKLKVVPR